VKIAVNRSANFKFKIELLSIAGNIEWEGNFGMTILVPRSGASLAFKNIPGS
jgi:hypothetical protein